MRPEPDHHRGRHHGGGRTSPALWFLIFATTLIFSTGSRAYGDVGVVLNGALDSGIARITASGHSAVYLSRICPASPVKLRLCKPGEEGSIISNYVDFGENQKFEWNIVPLSVFIYGTADERNRPLFGSLKVKKALEEQYRQRSLAQLCPWVTCGEDKNANWRDMVGEDLEREIYVFIANTTVEQDLELIARFNSMPNQDHFNAFSRNCADFTRNLVNTYFPHATHRDYINDFGMTSPKSVAHSFARYALHHPELQFRVLHFSQVPGTTKPSAESREGTEQLYHSAKLLSPLVYLAPHEVPVFTASYFLLGRFNPQSEFEEHPIDEAIQLQTEAKSVVTAMDIRTSEDQGDTKTVQTAERAEVLGTKDEWKDYREEYKWLADEAIREEIIPSRDSVKEIFKFLDKQGTPIVGHDGGLWAEVPFEEGTRKVGLAANTIFAPDSDSRLAYELLLARVGHELKNSPRRRETMQEFLSDWALLERARAKAASLVVESVPAATNRIAQSR